jgi:lysophospholipase L1-like esterase
VNTRARGHTNGANRYVFDLKEKIPYHSMEESERDEIWDDGLHFTSKGYERMGDMIAERLIEIIEAEKEQEKNEGSAAG